MIEVKELLKEMVLEAVGGAINVQPTQQVQQQNNAQQVQQQSNAQQVQTKQMQSAENKFNEISKLLNTISNNGNTALQNATKEFVGGINSFAKCSSGFDESMKNTLTTGMAFFKKGNEELGKLNEIFKNIQQLSQNISMMIGRNNN